MKKLSVLLVGAGSMGGAMLRGWVKSGILDARRSAVLMPNLKPEISEICAEAGVAINPSSAAYKDEIFEFAPHEYVNEAYDIVVLAVKPQKFAEVLPRLQMPDLNKALFISVAAGKTVDDIRRDFEKNPVIEANDDLRIIRVMPNLPVAVGQGMSIALAGQFATDADIDASDQLVKASGDIVWVKTEEKFDQAMAISGCGPAYVFLLSQVMAEAAKGLGFDATLAEKLAKSTVIGAGAQMASDPRKAEEMKQAVMSPGGTTAEAIRVLEATMPELMRDAVDAAISRAKEMSK